MVKVNIQKQIDYEKVLFSILAFPAVGFLGL